MKVVPSVTLYKYGSLVRCLLEINFPRSSHSSNLTPSLDFVSMSGKSPPPYTAVVATPFVKHIPFLAPPTLVTFRLNRPLGYITRQAYLGCSATLTASPSRFWRSFQKGKRSTPVSKTFAMLRPQARSSTVGNMRSFCARFVFLSARLYTLPFK